VSGTSPESKTLARCTQLGYGNLGDPAGSSEKGVWPTSDTKQGSQKACRESDYCIVPRMQGNSCEGKAVAESLPLEGEH
jgi:hypothetical protein